MITFTSDPNCINNIIYGYVIQNGSEILKKPYSDDVVEDPKEILDGCIHFFSDLDTEDSYIKCADLLRIKEKLITETV